MGNETNYTRMGKDMDTAWVQMGVLLCIFFFLKRCEGSVNTIKRLNWKILIKHIQERVIKAHIQHNLLIDLIFQFGFRRLVYLPYFNTISKTHIFPPSQRSTQFVYSFSGRPELRVQFSFWKSMHKLSCY